METHCRRLKALGVESSSYGTVLVNILLQRLLGEIKLKISRKMNEVSGEDNWNLDTLLDILKTEVESRGKCMITLREQYSQEVINKKPYRNTSIPAVCYCFCIICFEQEQTSNRYLLSWTTPVVDLDQVPETL